MSAHHAPGSVVRWCRFLATAIAVCAVLLLCSFVFGLFAVQASTSAGEASLTWALWGESSTTAYAAPIGQLVAGIGLLVFGALMSKTNPKIRRSEHDIPLVAAPWRRGEINRKVREVQAATAYRERRIGRRMIGFGIPAALFGALAVWLFPAVTAEIVDEGGEISPGASSALTFGAVATLAAVVAVISGILFVVRGPSEEASTKAELAERAAASVPSSPPPPMPTPPMPGTLPPPPTP